MSSYKTSSAFLALDDYFGTHEYCCGLRSGDFKDQTPSMLGNNNFINQIIARRALKKLPKQYRDHLFLAFFSSQNKVHPNFQNYYRDQNGKKKYNIFGFVYKNRQVNLIALAMNLASKSNDGYIDSYKLKKSNTNTELRALNRETKSYFFMLIDIFADYYWREKDDFDMLRSFQSKT